MNVKVCDGCKERIDGLYFTVDKERTDDRPIYSDYSFHSVRRWPRDTHRRADCIVKALEGVLEDGVQEA